MADAKGLNPGDPGYDPGSDPNAAQPQSGQAPVTGPGGTWAPPSSQDPAYLNQYKQVLAHLPSAGWSPGQTDPNYWVNRIASTNGGWDNQGNVDYFFGREMMGPNGQPGDSGNGNLPGTPAQALGNLPVSGFAPPMFTPPPAFTLPTEAQAAQQPGYKFSLDQGEAALEQSKAAQGVLNSGGTLKDILQFGQNAATQNYQNVVGQNLAAYNTNYQTQYLDPYNLAYQRAKDQFTIPNDYALRAFADQWNAVNTNAAMG